jgi:hypothetical protein
MDVAVWNAKEMVPIEDLETEMLTSLPIYEIAQNHVPSSY